MNTSKQPSKNPEAVRSRERLAYKRYWRNSRNAETRIGLADLYLKQASESLSLARKAREEMETT